MRRALLALLLTLGLAGPALAAGAGSTALQEAQNAYFQMQVADARRGFMAILGDPATPPDDVAAAARGLARIQWLIDADAPAAEATLRRGLAAKADLCPTTTYFARVLREAGQPREAQALAVQRAADCPGVALGDRLRLERARADLAWAAADPASRLQALRQTRAALNATSPTGLLDPDAAHAELMLAVEAGAGAAALDAWRSFFWLTDHNAPESFHMADAQVAMTFTRGLARSASLNDEIALERLLIRGGFFHEAERYDALRGVAAHAGALAAYRPVAAYFAFRHRFDATTLAFNRAYAHGHGDGAAYQAEVTRIFAETAAALGGGDPKAVLRDAFGLYGTVGVTGGVASVHLGHVVDDKQFKVDQFGRHGDLPFISIDNLVSNGYQSWLWDGMASTGGWSEGAAIVQIRASYTPGVLRALASFDPEVERRDAAELVQLEARDAAAVKAKPVAYLPGLQKRLIRQARDQVALRARAEARRTGQPFARAFAKTFWDAQVGHSIYIHEGRHALDHIQFTGAASLTSAELEFRAKLSELELAEFPRMALANILSADIVSDTSHGVADTRVIQGIEDWMAAHPGEIAGYDAAAPSGPQIDKLSDAQLRTIARGLDPRLREPDAPKT